jgi:hypothetical protein
MQTSNQQFATGDLSHTLLLSCLSRRGRRSHPEKITPFVGVASSHEDLSLILVVFFNSDNMI